jgi:hypothetical protein
MVRILIDYAPEPLVLWNCHDEISPWLQSREYLRQDDTILLNVFKDIESADRIELVMEWNVASIHLHEIHRR